jgi:hypothetical protein
VVERVPDHGMTTASLVVHFILTVITLGGWVFVWILYQLLARLTAKGVRVEAVEGDSSAGVRIYGPKDLVAEMATFVRRYDRGLANLSTSERGWEM